MPPVLPVPAYVPDCRVNAFRAERSPLLPAPQVRFALLLKIDPDVEVRQLLLEGLEGVLDVSERGEQL